MIAHSTAAGEKNSPAAVLCVFVHKKLSFDFEGNRLFLPGYRLPMPPYRSAMTVIAAFRSAGVLSGGLSMLIDIYVCKLNLCTGMAQTNNKRF